MYVSEIRFFGAWILLVLIYSFYLNRDLGSIAKRIKWKWFEYKSGTGNCVLVVKSVSRYLIIDLVS